MVGKKTDLLEELFKQRDQWREGMKNAMSLVKGQKLDWEINRQGKMKWYLHPAMKDRAIRSLVVFMQEIPPGSRSGKQKHQGGLVHYILEGKGYTVINGVKHDWEAGDVVVLPIFPDGLQYQHFNADPENRALFIAAEPNLFDALGVDMGSGFEQLESCPDYRA
jgi:gentisate 1,2-dioxygenase